MQGDLLLASCPQLLTKRELAQRYHVSVSCINKWMRQGLPRIRMRYKPVRFDPLVCDLYFAETCSPMAPQTSVRKRRMQKKAAKKADQAEMVQLELPFPPPGSGKQLYLDFGSYYFPVLSSILFHSASTTYE